jgi:hypothetical protein
VKPGSHRCGSRSPDRPPPEARIPWGEDHLRWRPARLPRAGRHPRPDRHGGVAALEWHQGELYPRVGFIVTNLKSPADGWSSSTTDAAHGGAMDREGKAALRWTRLSCRVFRANAVRLQLFALAYDLANFLRTLALPDAVAQWSLTTLREKLVKVGARLVRHGRHVTFQLAEVAVPRALFAEILRRIDRLRGPPVAAWPERTTERPAPRGEPCARGR